MMPLMCVSICNHGISPAKQVHFSRLASRQHSERVMLPLAGAIPCKYIGSSFLRRTIRGPVQRVFKDFHSGPRCMLPSS